MGMNKKYLTRASFEKNTVFWKSGKNNTDNFKNAYSFYLKKQLCSLSSLLCGFLLEAIFTIKFNIYFIYKHCIISNISSLYEEQNVLLKHIFML